MYFRPGLNKQQQSPAAFNGGIQLKQEELEERLMSFKTIDMLFSGVLGPINRVFRLFSTNLKNRALQIGNSFAHTYLCGQFSKPFF